MLSARRITMICGPDTEKNPNKNVKKTPLIILYTDDQCKLNYTQIKLYVTVKLIKEVVIWVIFNEKIMKFNPYHMVWCNAGRSLRDTIHTYT